MSRELNDPPFITNTPRKFCPACACARQWIMSENIIYCDGCGQLLYPSELVPAWKARLTRLLRIHWRYES